MRHIRTEKNQARECDRELGGIKHREKRDVNRQKIKYSGMREGKRREEWRRIRAGPGMQGVEIFVMP